MDPTADTAGALPQLHYTSAAAEGAAGGSGFRFTAVSPGVDPGTLRQAEPLLGYEPPPTAPARPTGAELAAFPVAFGLRRLPDGTGLLGRTVYTGADYSGRYGNFHAHAVLLPPDDTLPGGLLPIETWQSPDWRSGTPAEAEHASLPALRGGNRFGRTVLTAFARSRAERLAPFLADVRALFADEPGAPVLLVEEDAENVARWVALACAALPRPLARGLTFTTYTRRPYLADQQIVGLLPDADFAFTQAELTHQYRVHHCAGGPSSPLAATGPWAQAAARVWLAGRPDLFLTADPAEPPFAAAPLAARAVTAGIPLPLTARSAAARWALSHVHEGSPESWYTFLSTLTAPPPHEAGRAAPEEASTAAYDRAGDGDHPVDADEAAALAELLDALAARWAPEAYEPLARELTVRAVRGGTAAAPSGPERAPLTASARRELGALLGPELTAALGDPAVPPARLVALLRIAGTLGVDSGTALPVLSARLADHVLAPGQVPAATGGPAAGPTADDVAVALAAPEHAGLRTALLDRLADIAGGDDPLRAGAAARRLVRSWDGTDLADFPQLAMAAEADRAGHRDAGGITLWHRLVRECVPTGQPELLRTAFLLAWPDRGPATADACLVVTETAPDLLAAGGLVAPLLQVALGAPADDAEAPALARALLDWLPPGAAGPRETAALGLLELSEVIREGAAAPGFAARVVARLPDAEPLEEPVLDRLASALAGCVLAGTGAAGGTGRVTVSRLVLTDEQSALVRAGDGVLLRRYLRECAEPIRSGRSAGDPRQLAARFIAWSLHPAEGRGWDEARHRMLEEVLRPAVRRLPEDTLRQVEGQLAQIGAAWSDAWHAWQRPGLSRRWNRRRDTAADTRRGPWSVLSPRRPAPPDPPDDPPGPGRGADGHTR
ncbi:GTPase-associated protein 1-related protein [Streptomyces sp. NPDC004031]